LGVTIYKNTEVFSFSNNEVVTDKGAFTAENILICVPPKPFASLLKKSNLPLIWSGINVEKWKETNSYIIDIPISFHWKENVNLPKVWGFPHDDWAIAFVVLSDYMKPEKNYQLVISTCITRVNAKSKTIGKSAMESTDEEMINEVFRQLKISFPSLPPYDRAIIYQRTKTEEDTAFVETSSGSFIPMANEKLNNVFYIGTQNGNSYYSFTSMESAVTNALFALRKLDKKLKLLPIKKSFTLVDVLRLIFFIILILIIILLLKNER